MTINLRSIPVAARVSSSWLQSVYHSHSWGPAGTASWSFHKVYSHMGNGYTWSDWIRTAFSNQYVLDAGQRRP